jgi:ATP-dependent Lon protease
MSGLMKLLFPNMQFDKNELESVARLALEYRQRVRDWLHILSPGEYLKEKLNIEVKG